MMAQANMQAALWRNRQRSLARRLAQTVTPWSATTAVEFGQFVTVDNGQTLLQSQSPSPTTTGPTMPTGPSYADTVKWSVASQMQLLRYQYAGVPTP